MSFLEPAAFPRRQRSNVLLGLNGKQWILVSIGTVIMAFGVFFFQSIETTLLIAFVAVMFIGLGALSWNREPVLDLVIAGSSWLLREMVGTNTDTQDVWRDDAVEVEVEPELPEGETKPNVKKLYVLEDFGIPGRLKRLQLVSRRGSDLVFILDKASDTFTITQKFQSRAWSLMAETDQVDMQSRFDKFLASLTKLEGLEQMSVTVRSDATVADWVKDNAVKYDHETGVEHGNSFVRDEYDTVAETLSQSAVQFTYLMATTFRISKLRSQIKLAGGGLHGIANLAEQEMIAMTRSISQIGIQPDMPLTLDEWVTEFRRALNPIGFQEADRGERFMAPKQRKALVFGMREHANYVQVDETFHQTYWISEMPRSEVSAGFLENMIYDGHHSRVLTFQYRPQPLTDALRSIKRAKSNFESNAIMKERRGGRVTAEEEAEHAEMSARELQLARGAGAYKFRGFVSVNADDLRGLDQARASMMNAAAHSQCELQLRTFQQWPALVQTVLPVGVTK